MKHATKLDKMAEILEAYQEKSDELYATEHDKYGDYKINKPARKILSDWLHLQYEFNGITEDVRNEYENWQYGMADAAYTRWEDSQR